MEYCKGGELLERLTTNREDFTEHKTAKIMKALFLAVNHCHTNGIVHRDLKPENIMYDGDDRIKIIDFGFSKSFLDGDMHTIAGTPFYLAPEVLSGSYGKECDCWSLGVVMYIILSGYFPFPGNSKSEIYEKVKSGEFSFKNEAFDMVSDSAKDLIRKLLTVDKNKRYSCTDALAHPWFSQVESKKFKTPLD